LLYKYLIFIDQKKNRVYAGRKRLDELVLVPGQILLKRRIPFGGEDS
jgi:hypothetical protein